jgi:hypothetical protein
VALLKVLSGAVRSDKIAKVLPTAQRQSAAALRLFDKEVNRQLKACGSSVDERRRVLARADEALRKWRGSGLAPAPSAIRLSGVARFDKDGSRVRTTFIRGLSELVGDWTGLSAHDKLADEVATFADTIFPRRNISSDTVRKAFRPTTGKGRAS